MLNYREMLNEWNDLVARQSMQGLNPKDRRRYAELDLLDCALRDAGVDTGIEGMADRYHGLTQEQVLEAMNIVESYLEQLQKDLPGDMELTVEEGVHTLIYPDGSALSIIVEPIPRGE